MRLHLGTIGLGTILVIMILLVKLASAQSSSPAAASAPTSPKVAAPASQLPPAAPLTDVERIRLRTSQVALLKAQSARVCASIGELASTPEWQAAQQADAAFRGAIDAIFLARKIDQADYQICDGPGTQAGGLCAGLAKDTLELRAIPHATVAK